MVSWHGRSVTWQTMKPRQRHHQPAGMFGPVDHQGPRRGLGVLLAIAVAASTAGACPTKLTQMIPDGVVRERLQQQGIQVPLPAGATPELVPELPSRSAIAASVAAIGVTYGAEVLRLLPGGSCDWTALYNHLRAVSTLQGIEYFSDSRGHYRTLYQRSHAIVGPADRTPQPDPVASSVPRHSSLFLEQEDSTFGSNVYQADFRFDGVSIVMQMENLTTMWWGILPLVAEGDFRSVVTITPTDRGLLFYASAAIHAADLDFARERAQTSLGYRLDALEGWLRQRLAEDDASASFSGQ